MLRNIFTNFSVICIIYFITSKVVCIKQKTQFESIANTKIIGGESITARDIPYQVSIQYNGNHICGGVLITLEHALTAAQCLYRRNNAGIYEPIPVSEIIVKAGNEWLNNSIENVQYSFGHNLSIHLKYNPDSLTDFDNDIAVIKVSPVFNVTPTVSLASLRWMPSVAGEVCMVVGWGSTNEEEEALSQQLNKVNVPIFDYDICKNIYGDLLSDQMICAGYMEGGKDFCWGDTGGPLVCDRGVVAGIVSFKQNCGRPSYPGIYTEINPHVLWINQALATT